MVVDTYNRVESSFGHGPDRIVNPLLHFRVGTLNGIQLNSIFKFSGIH